MSILSFLFGLVTLPQYVYLGAQTYNNQQEPPPG